MSLPISGEKWKLHPTLARTRRSPPPRRSTDENAISRVYGGIEAASDEGDDEPFVEHEVDAAVIDLREAGNVAPAIKKVNQVLARALELGASDVHFTPQDKRLLVRARVDGVMRELATIPKNLQPAVTSRLKVMAELDIAERRTPQDGRLALRTRDRSVDLRVAVLPTTFGEKVTLRIMSSGQAAASLGELGIDGQTSLAEVRRVTGDRTT